MRLRILALLLDSESHGLCRLQRVKSVLWRHDVAVYVLHVPADDGHKALHINQPALASRQGYKHPCPENVNVRRGQ